MPMIGPDALPRHSPEVVFREVDDEVYLCAADGSTMYTLSEVGADIWRASDGTRTVREIVHHLLEIYDIDQQTLQQDVEEFLALLRDRKLLSWD